MKNLTNLTKDEILTIQVALQLTKSRYEKGKKDCYLTAKATKKWYTNALKDINKVDKKIKKIFSEL